MPHSPPHWRVSPPAERTACPSLPGRKNDGQGDKGRSVQRFLQAGGRLCRAAGHLAVLWPVEGGSERKINARTLGTTANRRGGGGVRKGSGGWEGWRVSSSCPDDQQSAHLMAAHCSQFASWTWDVFRGRTVVMLMIVMMIISNSINASSLIAVCLLVKYLRT